jgi:pyridoxal phosphate enzyme (YggS family)
MSIHERLHGIRGRIAAAAAAAGRAPAEITLIAVSKKQPAGAIREAYAAGQRDFGENYVQELAEKQAELADLPEIRWHFIGHLQSRKAREVADGKTWIHGLDSAGAIDKLAARAAERGTTAPVMLQVNIGGEASKAGITPGAAADYVERIRGLPSLALQGLMTIPPDDTPTAARAYFRRMRELRDTLTQRFGIPLGLSMGMSGDFEEAIAEGATWVRVGTAIFGERKT